MSTHAIEHTPPNPSADRESAVTSALHILNYLREVRPVWTHETPSREGYYWTRGAKGDEVEVVKVSLDYSEKEVPFVVQSGHAANVGVQYLRDYYKCEWCGPLEMPHES
jgi:hypothetical protein